MKKMEIAVNKSYTACFKLKVIKSAEKVGNRAAARKYDVHERCVRRWRAEKDDLKKMPKLKRAQRSGVVPWPDLEVKLESWIKKQQNKGLPISMFHIRSQAKLMAEKMGIKDFKGGSNWCYRFMKRKKLSANSRFSLKDKLQLENCGIKIELPNFYSSSVIKSYTAGFKLTVIEKAEKIGNRAASREFDVDERCVRRWRSEKEDLERMPKFKRSQRGGNVAWPSLEEKLATWVLKQQNQALTVSVAEIRAHAKLMAQQMGITGFIGSSNWYYNFLKRKKLSVATKCILNRNSKDYSKNKLFVQNSITELIQELELAKAQVINMFVVSYAFDCIPDKCNTKIKDNTLLDTEKRKMFCTCLLACAANGDKLKPFIVFRQNTISKGNYASDIIIRSNEEGWRCDKVIQEWLNEVWRKRRGADFEPRGILIVDSIVAQLLESVIEDCEKVSATVVVIPKELSPLNTVIDTYFKSEMLQRWEQWRKGSEEMIPEEIARWVEESWKTISVSIIISGFTEVEIIKLKSDEISEDNVDLKKTNFKKSYNERVLDDEVLRKIFNSDSDNSDFDGFS